MVTVNINTSKEWWKSKTIWANIGLIVVGVITDVLTGWSTGGALTFAALLNIALRSVSKHEIRFTN